MNLSRCRPTSLSCEPGSIMGRSSRATEYPSSDASISPGRHRHPASWEVALPIRRKSGWPAAFSEKKLFTCVSEKLRQKDVSFSFLIDVIVRHCSVSCRLGVNARDQTDTEGSQESHRFAGIVCWSGHSDRSAVDPGKWIFEIQDHAPQLSNL